jgi:hypothetical protein
MIYTIGYQGAGYGNSSHELRTVAFLFSMMIVKNGIVCEDAVNDHFREMMGID